MSPDQPINPVRAAVLATSLHGILICGPRPRLPWLDPRVGRRIGEKIDTLSNTRIAGLAQRALQKTDVDIQRTQTALHEELPYRVANVIADMLNADCECRKRLVAPVPSEDFRA